MVNSLCTLVDASFDNYFANLVSFGRVKQDNINNLLILMFIDKMQRGDFLTVPGA